MTNAVMIWCRHKGDNVIGVNNQLPWHIESDAQHFWNIVAEQNLVCGRKTYESFPENLPPLKRIFIFSGNADYEVRDKKRDIVVSSQKELENLLEENEDFYIAGGAEIYRLFMAGKEKFKPHIVVDCVYEGEITGNKDGVIAEISSCISVLNTKYRKITPDYVADKVFSSIWIRKGEFVEQKILKHIFCVLESDTTVSVNP